MDIRCSIHEIDFDGRTDTDSAVKIIQQVRPRELLLIGAELERIEEFITAVRNTTDTIIKDQMTLYTPTENGAILNCTQKKIYQVRLKDQLVSKLTFQSTRGVEVTWLDGVINFSSKNAADRAKERAEQQKNGDQNVDDDIQLSKNMMAQLDQKPSVTVEDHDPVFINDVRLSDFKAILLENNLRAEFVGGVLIVNGLVALRRTHQGHIELEGSLNSEYYKVRELLYGQYALM